MNRVSAVKYINRISADLLCRPQAQKKCSRSLNAEYMTVIFADVSEWR